MKLSILVPVYNERAVVERSLAQVLDAPLPENMERELIIVDDRSTDGTWDILQRLAAAEPRIRLHRHEFNQGKGAAVRTCIQYASGDFCLVQDADLEYDPYEYPRLLRPLLDGHADAVFGSRYMTAEQRRVLPFWHSMINKGLTLVSNMFSNLNVTDMETCYKVFRTDILKSIPVRSDRFGFEPEITMKCAKRRLRIYEVPISYHGRTYEEGKKIGWRDGLKAFGVILHFWLIDDLYTEVAGRGLTNSQYGTPRYLTWITGVIRPHLRDTVLEVGAGNGNFSGRLMGKKMRYIAAESDPVYLRPLRNRFLRTPNVEVRELDPNCANGWDQLHESVESALCVNVLEYSTEPGAVVERLREALKPGGVLVVLVPLGRKLYGSVDESLGLRQRFEPADITALLAESGFAVRRVYHLNKIGRPGWWFNSRVIRKHRVGRLSLKIFDRTVWLWKWLNPVMPWPGLSLVVVAERVR
jgi:glycosyltransferase involved in cell wall biosynthesis/phospholipid N-methyltransferase